MNVLYIHDNGDVTVLIKSQELKEIETSTSIIELFTAIMKVIEPDQLIHLYTKLDNTNKKILKTLVGQE